MYRQRKTAAHETKKTKDMAQFELIQNRWQQAAKFYGLSNVLTLADGTQIRGRYVLTGCGACTASHDALQGFTPSAGFPTDANGGSVNDRDYQRDQDAQNVTRTIAAHYDARALQSPVIVSGDGVVLSGNGRTMAGELAARDNTDGAYLEHLRAFCGNYGFTRAQIDSFAHARVLFEIDDVLPYTVTTFARFNAQEMKSQSKTEQAIKYGKLVTDDAFARIVATVNAFETLSDFYQCTEAVTRVLADLRGAGVVGTMQYAEMFDGDGISATGKEVLENVLIGKAFATDPDAARKITSYKNIRKAVVIALGELSNNIVLGDGYALTAEIQQAIALAYQARKEGDYKDGEQVSAFARQMNLFEAGTVADYNNITVLMLADVLNDAKTAQLKKLLAVYNHQASDAANGQTDMFCTSGVKTKAEILADVRTLFATGTQKEQKEAVKASTDARIGNSLFLTDEQLTKVVKGSYVEYTCKCGDTIICKVDAVKKGIAYLSAKGGIKLWHSVSQLVPTDNHNLTLPEWIKAGNVITDGTASQRIIAVTDGSVILEWINGGYFDVSLPEVLKSWRLSESDVCEIKEAA